VGQVSLRVLLSVTVSSSVCYCQYFCLLLSVVLSVTVSNSVCYCQYFCLLLSVLLSVTVSSFVCYCQYFCLLLSVVLSVTVSTFLPTLHIHLHLNPLNAELNPICYLLALLGGATIVVFSRLRVNNNKKCKGVP
jgi:hypothetical protein